MVPFESLTRFLFAFYSNYGRILYRFPDKAKCIKHDNFFHTTCIRRCRWEVTMPFGMEKLKMVWLPDGEKV